MRRLTYLKCWQCCAKIDMEGRHVTQHEGIGTSLSGNNMNLILHEKVIAGMFSEFSFSNGAFKQLAMIT